MAIKGEIINWDSEKGFGFIRVQSNGAHVFVHISAFRDRQHPPTVHQPVQFILSMDQQGRSCAQKVTRKKDKHSKGFYLGLLTFLFWSFLIGALYFVQAPLFIFALYIVMSAITFGVYALDKLAARAGRWRTPEKTLHLLALFGGWPGALLAQTFLRHKSTKFSFRWVFWLTLCLNMGAILSGFYFFSAEHLDISWHTLMDMVGKGGQFLMTLIPDR
jgi:uncharacterized membrane protein YsdA (DUF1294 family)/cold shock CspA family protein